LHSGFNTFFNRPKGRGIKPLGTNKQTAFFLYCLFIPLAVFVLAFFISLKKPMISYRYIMSISFPFFVSFAALIISMCASHKKLKFLSLFLVWAISSAIYSGIPAGGTGYYRESYAYIAADIAAHPGQKSAVLNNTPQIAHYYGSSDLQPYSPENPPDVLYVLKDLFSAQEATMYDELAKHGFDDTNMLKIYPNDKIVIFKKLLL
jgi:hypothetical protein